MMSTEHLVALNSFHQDRHVNNDESCEQERKHDSRYVVDLVSVEWRPSPIDLAIKFDEELFDPVTSFLFEHFG